MRLPDMILQGGLVLLPDGSTQELDIRIENGGIAELAADAHWTDADVVDARGRLVAPGLINTHCHSNENYFKGLFDNLPLELWLLFSYPLLAAPQQTPREIYLRTMLGCIEMLKSGCSTVVDFIYEFPEMTGETVAAAMQAYLDSGMRVLLVVSAADKIYYETTPIVMDLLTPELKAQLDAEPIPSAEESL